MTRKDQRTYAYDTKIGKTPTPASSLVGMYVGVSPTTFDGRACPIDTKLFKTKVAARVVSEGRCVSSSWAEVCWSDAVQTR